MFIWNVNSNTLAATWTIDFVCQFVSFRPFHEFQFTMGGYGGAVVCTINSEYTSEVNMMDVQIPQQTDSKAYVMQHVQFEEQMIQDAGEASHQFVCHCWDTSNAVYIMSNSGYLSLVDASSGKLIKSTRLIPPNANGIVVSSLVLVMDYVIVALTNGLLTWLRMEDFTIARKLQLEDIAKVDYVQLYVSPSYNALYACVGESSLFALNANLEEDEEASPLDTKLLHSCHDDAILASAIVTPAGGTRKDAVFLSGGRSGLLRLRTVENMNAHSNYATLFEAMQNDESTKNVMAITSMASNIFKPLLLIGLESGHLCFLHVRKTHGDVEPTMLNATKLFKSPISLLSLNIDLQFVAVGSLVEENICIMDSNAEASFRMVTWLTLENGDAPTAMHWYEETQLLIYTKLGFVYTCGINNKHYTDQSAGITPKKLIDSKFAITSSVFADKIDRVNHTIVSTTIQKKLYLCDISNAKSPMAVISEQAHDKGISCLRIASQHCSEPMEKNAILFASGSVDGTLKIWSWDTQKKQLSMLKNTKGHSSAITSIAFVAMPTYTKIVTTAMDGSICFMHLTYSGSKASEKVLQEIALNLSQTNNFTPEQLYEKKTVLEKLFAVQAATKKEKDEIAKEKISVPLKALQLKLSAMLHQNKRQPPEEQLDRSVFYVNDPMRTEVGESNIAAVKKVKEGIQREIAANQEVLQCYKAEFWDNRLHHGIRLHPILGQGSPVFNFPLRKHLSDEVKLNQNLLRMRRTEFKQQLAINGKLESAKASRVATWMIAEGMLHPYVLDEIFNSTNPGPLDLVNEWKGLIDIIYHPVDLLSPNQERIQIALLNLLGRILKQLYNNKHLSLRDLKESKLDEIRGKNARIKEIAEELGTEIERTEPLMHADEHPEDVITIADSELQSRPYETSEKRRVREEAEKKKLALELERKKEDVAGRALQDMMDGTLHVAKRNAIQITLEKEAWMIDIPVSEMSSDQKVLYDAFILKENSLIEERAVYRKALEMEAKKLSMEVQGICKMFDEQVANIFKLRSFVSHSLLAQESWVAAIAKKQSAFEITKQEISDLRGKALTVFQKVETSSAKLASTNSEYEKLKKEVTSLAESDKQLDKNFLPEMERQCGSNFPPETVESISDLYKRRIVASNKFLLHKQHSNSNMPGLSTDKPESGEENNFNPYAMDVSSKNVAKFPNYLPLNAEKDMPESLSPDSIVWKLLVEFRDAKLASEANLFRKNICFQACKQLLDDLQIANQNLEDEKKRLDELVLQKQLEMAKLERNIPFLARLKQGQNESTVLNNAQLILRNGIEDLNKEILLRGNEKVSILIKMKTFRKSINVLLWEFEYYTMQCKHLEEHYTDLQLLRVTQHLQQFLKQGTKSSDPKHQEKIALQSAENKLAFGKSNHQTNTLKLKKANQLAQMQLQAKQLENQRLSSELETLQSHIKIRQELVYQQQHRNEDSPSQPSGKAVAQAKMKRVVNRRKLLDLVKNQTSEIEALRHELDDLRRKTFPSFPTAT